MSNIDNPHGLRPLGVTLSGGPIAVSPFRKNKDTAIYAYDALHLAKDGSVDGGQKPASALYCGVSLSAGLAGTEGNQWVVVSPDAIFEAQPDDDPMGIVAGDAGSFANLILNPGNPKTLISGHEIDTSTVGQGSDREVRLLKLLDAPDNKGGEFAAFEITILKHTGARIHRIAPGTTR